VLVCNDARMTELYWGCYRFDPEAPDVPIILASERVSSPLAVAPAPGVGRFAGNGFSRFPELQARLTTRGLRFHEGLYPSAAAVARIGAGQLRRGEALEAAQAQPVYIRDDVIRSPKPTVMPLS
jgi:tRNA threonylcarbamoyladenosine biosynthesis protein TsaB